MSPGLMRKSGPTMKPTSMRPTMTATASSSRDTGPSTARCRRSGSRCGVPIRPGRFSRESATSIPTAMRIASGAALAIQNSQVKRSCAGSGMRLQAMRQTGDPLRNRKRNGPDPVHAESPSTAVAGLRSRSRSASATARLSGAVTAARAMASGSNGVSRMPVTTNAEDCHHSPAGTRSIRRRPSRIRRPERATAPAIPRTAKTKTQFIDAKPETVL